jgi:hypothetical protein
VTSLLASYQAPKLDEPLVVLSYPYSGVVRLRSLLEYLPDMSWIGADLVKSCGQLVADWQQLEGRDGTLSRLALTSITTVFNTMVTTHLLGTGALRYCIPAVAGQEGAEGFALVYPKAKFLCLHRSALDVIYSAVAANPWGLAGGPCAEHSLAYPGNSVAAAAAFWAKQSSQLLAFEQAHPDSTLRIRYEDLDADPAATARRIGAFAGIPGPPVGPGGAPVAEGVGAASLAPVGCGAQVPAERMPSAMVGRVNELLRSLDYDILP